MIKQAVIITANDKPIMVLPVTTFQSAEDYVKFEQECKKNYAELKKSQDDKELGVSLDLIELKNRIDNLQVELSYQKGEITEEEYLKLIGKGE